jgi:hypothetical protein
VFGSAVDHDAVTDLTFAIYVYKKMVTFYIRDFYLEAVIANYALSVSKAKLRYCPWIVNKTNTAHVKPVSNKLQ